MGPILFEVKVEKNTFKYTALNVAQYFVYKYILIVFTLIHNSKLAKTIYSKHVKTLIIKFSPR